MATREEVSFESACRPILEEIAARVRQRFPRFEIVVGSSYIPHNRGHLLSVDGVRESLHTDEPNCLSLCMEAKNLDSTPLLCTLDVCWGGDGRPPCDGVDCLDAALPWGSEAILKVESSVPMLEESFVHCLTEWEKTYGSKNA